MHKNYFEYYLNSKTGKVSKLQYKRTGDSDLAVFTIQSIRKSECLEVKGDWDKDKIEKSKKDKEQERILKAQEKIKKEQSAVIKCQGSDPANWTNCKGIYQSETGHGNNRIKIGLFSFVRDSSATVSFFSALFFCFPACC